MSQIFSIAQPVLWLPTFIGSLRHEKLYDWKLLVHMIETSCYLIISKDWIQFFYYYSIRSSSFSWINKCIGIIYHRIHSPLATRATESLLDYAFQSKYASIKYAVSKFPIPIGFGFSSGASNFECWRTQIAENRREEKEKRNLKWYLINDFQFSI